MPERDRPSLTGLAIKRPLPERGKPLISLGEAEAALLGGPQPGAPAAAATAAVRAPVVPQTIQPDIPPTVQSPVLSPSLLKARKRPIKIAWTFKIPHTLHQELSSVAAHNGLTMSDIVIEAIQFHLPNFPHPSKP
jgi:hypothetical protein